MTPRPAPRGGDRLREDPEAWLIDFAAGLREAGIPSSLTETIAARECIPALDTGDALDMLFGFRAAFCASARDVPVFDRCFWEHWSGASGPPSTPVIRAGGTASPAGPPAARRGDEPEATIERLEPGEASAVGTAYSAAEHVSRRSFASVGDHELREFDRWIERLMIRLSSRRSRRLEPGGRRGPVDLRRSAAHAVRTDGEWIRLARRRRRQDPPRLVVLCDISGSMERYSRFLVRFLLATGRAKDIETFAFSTRLTHLTPWLARTRVDRALDELRARGWSSGTRIGECLETFVERHGRAMLGQRTLVVILSDGLDQGEVEPLRRAMSRIQSRARRVIWLNPLLESSRYAPEARGMRAALPYVDDFASGHNLEALRRLPDLLRL